MDVLADIWWKLLELTDSPPTHTFTYVLCPAFFLFQLENLLYGGFILLL